MLKGFERGDKIERHQRVILSLDGGQSSGKTHFGLTAPKPIVVFDFDLGMEHVIHKFDQTQIFVRQFGSPSAEKDSSVDWKKEWTTCKNSFLEALKHKDVRTILIDTATEWWELVRMARLGRLEQVLPHHYGPVNAEMRTLVREAHKHGKNLILTHKHRPKYVNDKWTGEYEMAGSKDVRYLAQVCLRMDKTKDGVEYTIWKARQDRQLEGMVLAGDGVDFDMVAGLVMP